MCNSVDVWMPRFNWVHPLARPNLHWNSIILPLSIFICTRTLFLTSLLLRRFVFRMAEASAKRVTGDEPQGTMGRVQTTGEAPARSRPLSPSRLPLRAHFHQNRDVWVRGRFLTLWLETFRLDNKDDYDAEIKWKSFIVLFYLNC